MGRFRIARSPREKAAALLIVLAMVVLLTGLAIAYLSRTTSDRPVAHASFHQSRVDVLAQSAMDLVIGDLQQEITNGSTAINEPDGSTLYTPTSAANTVPQRRANAAGASNLIRVSVRSDNPASPGVGSRASAVNSTTDASANGRFVTTTRWNKHYLIPKGNVATTDSSPVPSFTPPDWVIVTRAGPTPFASWDATLANPSNSNYAIGRYAYAVYDEGGLLDMNAAGYPSSTTLLQYGRKGSLAFADLTGLPGLSSTAVDNIVGWRNYASSEPTGSLPGFSFSTNATNTYFNFIVSDPNYIQLTNYFTNAALTYFTNSFLTTSGAVTPSPSPAPSPRTDQQL